MRPWALLLTVIAGCAGSEVGTRATDAAQQLLRKDPARCSPDLQAARDIVATAEHACSYERLVGGIDGADQACAAIREIGKPSRDTVYWLQTQCPVYQLAIRMAEDGARLAAISRRLALDGARMKELLREAGKDGSQ